MRWPGALAAVLLLALLACTASAQPRIAARFSSLREACEQVPEIAKNCGYIPSSVMGELSSLSKAFTLFLTTNGTVLEDMLGEENAHRVYTNPRIATKYTFGMLIPNRLLTACTLRALALSQPMTLPTKLPRSTLTFAAVPGTQSCNFSVNSVASTGNTYLIGKGIMHTLQEPVVLGTVVPDIFAVVSAQAGLDAWSTVASATSGIVSRLTAVFTRPASVACPAPELVARASTAHPELTSCIAGAAKGCAAGWGTPATVFCSSDKDIGATWAEMSHAERSAFPCEQAEARLMQQLYIPGQRLSLADLAKASSLTAKAGNTIDVSCADGSCSVRTSPSTPAAALVEEVPLGDGIMLLAASSSVWPRAT